MSDDALHRMEHRGGHLGVVHDRGYAASEEYHEYWIDKLARSKVAPAVAEVAGSSPVAPAAEMTTYDAEALAARSASPSLMYRVASTDR